MRFLLILFSVVSNCAQYATSLKKCCDLESYLLKTNNSTYTCDKDTEKRLQIITNDTNRFKDSNATIEDKCVDVDGTDAITEYKFRNQSVLEEKKIPVNFFPKCCPLKSYYNSITHSCVWADYAMDESFIKQNFVKVGLPQCRVIVDYKLNSEEHYHRMELGELHIDSSMVFREGQFCIDKDEKNALIARGCYNDLDVCNKTRCIHKCCPDGQSFVNGQKCENTYTHGLNLGFSKRINNSQDPFAIIHKYNCRIYILREKIRFYLDTDGVFWAFHNFSNSFKRFEIDDPKSYCIEHVYKKSPKKSLNNFEFFMCFPDKPIAEKFLTTRWAKLCSCLFIVITVAVYLFLPEMLNLFGKILISYCTAMLSAYIILTYTQFVMDRSDDACVVIGFLTLYTSLSAFSWLNIMCFDIWWTFGTPKSLVTVYQRRNELKKFLLYSLYGWGAPAFLTLLTFLAYAVFDTPHAVRPFVGSYTCFLEKRDKNYATFVYYAIPLIFMEMVNLILFAKTLIYCLKVKGEINRMNDNRIYEREKKKSFKTDKEQLILIIKLCFTMGIPFVFEVVSSLYTFSQNSVTMYIEIVWDTVNCLQGLFIFLIFICKVKVFRLCRSRILRTRTRKISLSSVRTTGTTQTTPLTSSTKIRNV